MTEWKTTTPENSEARQLAQKCRENRARALRLYIRYEGYRLDELVLIQYQGFPVFHISESPATGEQIVDCEDKFIVIPKKFILPEDGLVCRQRKSGLWYALGKRF